MAAGQARPPWRHHYLPEFYLKRWTSSQGPAGVRNLVEFSMPHGAAVKSRWVSPRGTGFLDGREALEGLSPEHARLMEARLLAPVDGKAAAFLRKLEAGSLGFTSAERTAWASFIMSLVLRHPENVGGMLDAMRAQLRGIYARMAEAERPGEGSTRVDGLTLDEAMRHDLVREGVSRKVVDGLVEALDTDVLVRGLVDRRWGLFTFPDDAPALLTSDRPLLWFLPFDHASFQMLLPVGPKTVFWAANPDRYREGVTYAADPHRLAALVNDHVTRRARRFVYALDGQTRGYVQDRMGVDPVPNSADAFTDILRRSFKR